MDLKPVRVKFLFTVHCLERLQFVVDVGLLIGKMLLLLGDDIVA